MNEISIELPESITIHRIESIFGDLKIEFNSEAPVIKIIASKVDTIDTSGLQALLALVLESQKKNKQVIWESPSENFILSAKQIGLTDKLQLP